MATDLIGTKEAAHLLDISRSTLTRRVLAGKLAAAVVAPGYRGPLLFDRADIEALTQGDSNDDHN